MRILDEQVLNIEKREKGLGEWKSDKRVGDGLKSESSRGKRMGQFQLREASLPAHSLPTIQWFFSVGFDSVVVYMFDILFKMLTLTSQPEECSLYHKSDFAFSGASYIQTCQTFQNISVEKQSKVIDANRTDPPRYKKTNKQTNKCTTSGRIVECIFTCTFICKTNEKLLRMKKRLEDKCDTE